MGHAVEVHRFVDQWAGIRDEIVAILDREINRGDGSCLVHETDLNRPSAPSLIRGNSPFARCASRSVGGYVIRGNLEATWGIPADACSSAQVFVVGGLCTIQS